MLRILALPVLATAVLTDCVGARPPDGVVCTTEARPSVQVRAVDTRDQPLVGAHVRYRLDGGPEQGAQCVLADTDAGVACPTWTAEYERTGTFALEAVAPDGERRAVAETTVQRDECHVITQNVRLVLPDPPGTPPPGTPCTPDLRPSVRVQVVDVRDQPVDVAQVAFRVDDGAERSATCAARDERKVCLTWLAGEEEPGVFRVTSRGAEGRPAATAVTTVVRDACHVLTQDVRLVLPD